MTRLHVIEGIFVSWLLIDDVYLKILVITKKWSYTIPIGHDIRQTGFFLKRLQIYGPKLTHKVIIWLAFI